jgi:hypothetical protein
MPSKIKGCDEMGSRLFVVSYYFINDSYYFDLKQHLQSVTCRIVRLMLVSFL